MTKITNCLQSNTNPFGFQPTSITADQVNATASRYTGYDHIKFTVTNAKQAATYYCIRFGFKHVAYKGLETGSREVASHVIKQNNTIFVFESAIQPESMKEMTDEIARRGDGVKDVAFTVTDVRAVYEKAVARGAKSIRAPHEETDKDGSVILATIATVSETGLCTLVSLS
jgi:4-hydroxyphenylpyruvate dioxygenase